MNKKVIILFLLMFSFNHLAMANQKSEVKSFLKKHNKAFQTHNIQKIETFYDKNYQSTDGFDLKDALEMVEKTHKTYKNIAYKTKLHSLDIKNDLAIAHMSEKTSATIYPYNNKKYKNKAGYLNGISTYDVYMKKTNEGWKIYCDDIIEEETKITYGVAKNIPMELVTPQNIQKNQDYTLSLKMKKPKNIIAIGSISNEEITYPTPEYKETFRKIPATGELERLVKSNNKNLDEYALASIGFTKISLNEEQSKARIEIIGMGYLMKRINMEKENSEKKSL